ncbi:MAG: hypothetical protein JNK14_15575 [Chitinophagaceae bacterium]|nr:hypothetical protein [Chitinophagaceae bacterium]
MSEKFLLKKQGKSEAYFSFYKNQDMLKEEYLQQLLNDLYERGSLDIFDYTAELFPLQSEEFGNTKCWADQLVRDKMARYADDDHTTLLITNFGRYWVLKGGYESFLRDGLSTKDKEKGPSTEKEKLIEARLKLTQYRLTGFWLALVISCIGFVLTLLNLYLLLR